MHILLVEDNDTLSHLFRVQLRQLGEHTLIIVSNKAAAMDAFKKDNFDLVFVDMGLEGYPNRGLEILTGMKALVPQQRIGVLSSNDLKDTVRLSEKAGAEFYMVKPFSLEGLALILAGDKKAIQNYIPEPDEGRIIVFE